MGQQYPRPETMTDDEFLAWCEDDTVPLGVRGDAYLARTMQAAIPPVLTKEHATLWTALQTGSEASLEPYLQPAPPGTPWRSRKLTTQATLMYFDTLAVRHGNPTTDE